MGKVTSELTVAIQNLLEVRIAAIVLVIERPPSTCLGG
jgi:hypothetical protein